MLIVLTAAAVLASPPFGAFARQVDGLYGLQSIAIGEDGEVETSTDVTAGSTVGWPLRGRSAHELTAFDEVGETFAFVDVDGTLEVGPDGFTRDRAYPGARGLALADDGSVWLADTLRHRIVRLDSMGNEVSTFGARGAFPGLFNAPAGLAVFDGECFVADTLNHRVVVHDAESGVFKYQWGMHAVVVREGEGKIHYPEDVAVAADGSFVAVLEPFERRYQRFERMEPNADPSGTLPKKLAVESHFGPELGIDGEVLVMHEPESGAAMVFDLRMNIPIHVTTFARAGTGVSQLGHIASIAVDAATQEVWFLDEGNQRIAAWRLNRDPNARLRQDPFMASFVRAISFDALAARIGGERFVPGRLLVVDGLLNIIERNGSRVAIVTPRFEVEGIVGLEGEHAHTVVRRVAAHPEGGWVVLREPNHTLVRFGRDGSLLGPIDAMADNPFGVAVLEDGSIVVSERNHDQLLVITEHERRIISESGAWDGAMWRPAEVHPFTNGRVVVVDQGNHRAQVFDPETGEWSLTFSLGMGHDTPMFLKEDAR